MSYSVQCERILSLSTIEGLGLKTFYRLLQHAGSLDDLYHSNAWRERCGLDAKLLARVREVLEGREPDKARVYRDKVGKWLSDKPDRYLICMDDAQYPPLLKEIYCPPPLLYMEGKPSVSKAETLAVVGSRKPSLSGLRHTQDFVSALACAGLAIVSGLALGIDAAAHRAALSENAVTLGVLATGLDKIYPKQHAGLAQEIAEQGLLISEMPLGTPAIPGNFPRRNRIVSGLSSGVLVVEAGLKSGSLITARFALEQNRDVFAIPGSIDSLLAQGCHALIKEGACLVESAEDVLQEFNSCRPDLVPSGKKDCLDDLSEQELLICRALNEGLTEFDSLLAFTGHEAAKLMELLLALELRQCVAQVPGGYALTKAVNLPA